jgi:Asp/Glu/hydantoin racemase
MFRTAAGVVRSRDLGGVAGYAVGVLHVASPFVFVPGNIQNATTMPFPVAYECVPNVTLREVLSGNSAVESGLVSAARRLEARGVGFIVGACGSFANFQRTLANAVSVPVCASILTQVPWLLNCLSHDQRVGIVFADLRSFTERTREQCGIVDVARLVITDCMDLPPFRALIDQPYVIDHRTLEAAVAQHIANLVAANPDIGVVVLQCSELPPYAAAIQSRIGRPVIDINTVVAWAQSVAVRTPYSGYL